jgi:hypothetical protein
MRQLRKSLSWLLEELGELEVLVLDEGQQLVQRLLVQELELLRVVQLVQQLVQVREQQSRHRNHGQQ